MPKTPFTTYFSLRRHKQTGTATVQIRVAVGGIRSEKFSSGIRLTPADWDARRRRAKDRPDINASLAEIEADLTGIYHLLKAQGSVSAQLVRYHYLHKALVSQSRVSLPTERVLDDFSTYEQGRPDLEPQSKDKYLRIVRLHLLPILADSKLGRLPAAELRRSHAEQVVRMVRQRVKSVAYQGKVAGYFRTFCSWAHSHGLIPVDPMYGMRIPRGQGNPTNLTPEQQKAIRQATLPGEALRYSRDMFVFQLETGLNYADCKKAKGQNIVESAGRRWLVIFREKEKESQGERLEQVVHLTKEAEAIGARYGWDLMRYENGTYNDHLKAIAGFAGVQLELTSRMARSTFSQNKIDAGLSEGVILRMMGKKSAEDLRRSYAQASFTRISLELDRVEVGRLAT